jgi:hypothetical protein
MGIVLVPVSCGFQVQKDVFGLGYFGEKLASNEKIFHCHHVAP